MKIGIYAGTFDPIHNGHIEFALAAITQVQLDRIIVVAEKDPYRKEPHASWDHRQAMIERATEGLEQVDHDYEFANILAHQHTMQDMLTNARRHYGEDAEIWFLVGSDVFEHMGAWKDMANTNNYGGFAVALKDDHTASWLAKKVAILENQGIDINMKIVSHKNSHISSSNVREVMSGGGTTDEVDARVSEYIKNHNLYDSVSSVSSGGVNS